MKRIVLTFLRKGAAACCIGPLVLAVLYWILHRQGQIQTLMVDEVCTGIISLSCLAFVAGGMNVVYQIERLPLLVAIFIHGSVLYGAYLLTYLVNGWLEQGILPVVVFTGIFVLGYLVIWGIIYSIIKRNTDRVNELLENRRAG